MYKGEDQILGIIASKKRMPFQALAEQSGMNEDSLRRILEALKSSGYIKTDVSETAKCIPTEEFRRYRKIGFPEYSVFEKSQQDSTRSVASLSPEEKSVGIRWAKLLGFVAVEEGGRLSPRKQKSEVDSAISGMIRAFDQIDKSGSCDDAVLLEQLYERHLLERKTVRAITIEYTGKPIDAALLRAGAFDVSVPSADANLGKSHPITRLTKRMKTIMSELGFQEMDGSIIESSFWNFDALFQPQNHPARELADTFYLEGKSPLPADKTLVARVKKAHEDGWKYGWDPLEASKRVLRTHTTCLSARTLSSNDCKKPRKFFAIGRVFRNEATDYKHLAEFHQVEGIIAWEGATFTDLLGILKEFYGKLGFKDIRFRPSFFPYTEPSLEIEVYYEPRKQWLELGGGGIFRPEVSGPLGCDCPVLAWGLSLERPLMLMLELDDIRTFYRNDVEFLKDARLDP